MELRSAVAKVNKKGLLLVFPANNRKEPASLWSEFFPRSEMRWEWDEGGDNRVAQLWHLRERLSSSGKVVYAKWFRGRATVISRELFPALLKTLAIDRAARLDFQSEEILSVLEEDSPLSTKQLKRATDLSGRERERIYEAALKKLWSRLLIVGYGEVDEGAFPSLAIGATRLIFEDLWTEAHEMSAETAEGLIEKYLPKGSAFRKFHDQQISRLDRQLLSQVDELL